MTQRLFSLKGNLYSTPARGTVNINGTEVFNGEFSVGAVGEPDGFLCEFAYTFDDSAGTNVELPVTVTVTSGSAWIGMFKYNYAQVPNPALTPEELVYVTTKTTSSAPAEIQADVKSKGGWYIHDETAFNYGITPTACADNRNSVFLNGIAIPDQDDNTYIEVDTTGVLAFNTIVFSSVYPPV